jgi:hypothetical protein
VQLKTEKQEQRQRLRSKIPPHLSASIRCAWMPNSAVDFFLAALNGLALEHP